MRAIAFDLDGTLFDHRSAGTRAIVEWVERKAWPSPDDLVERWFRIEDHRFGEYAAGVAGLQEQRRNRVRDLLTQLDVPFEESSLDGLFAEFLTLYRANWTGFSDARETLESLRARGYVLAVLTNGYYEQQRDKLEAIGLLEFVEHLLASADLPAFKPDVRAYEALCSALGLEPYEVMYVGDDVTADAMGARDAGLRSVHLDRDGTAEPISGVTQIRSLREVLEQLA